MRHDRGWAFRGALAAAAAGTLTFTGVAQAQIGGAAETPGAALRRQLTELAANPNSVSELVETGRAALAVGDGEAALGFFTRATQLAPRDARAKAGLAAAHARTGRAETALVLFNEAASLGAPEAEIAGERGLAYDLLGQTARAQQDYHTSLRHREDAEVRRRLALSLAISGQRDAALRLIDEQVRGGDRAASRTRVMVLALTGDVRGATAAANASLPPQAAQSLAPFLTRLAALSPAQMASAANLGRVSSSGGMRMAGSQVAAADPGALAFAGGGSAAPALRNRLPVAPSSTAPRRRPGADVFGQGGPVTLAQRNSTASTPPTGQQRVWNNAGAAAARSPAVAAPAASIAAASTATVLLPHPHQPLRLPGVPAASPSGSDASMQEPVQLAGGTGPRVPAAVVQDAPSSEPLLTAAAPAVQPPVAAQAAAPVQQPVAAAQQPATSMETATPLLQQAAAPAADGASANLAAWNLAPAGEAQSAPTTQAWTPLAAGQPAPTQTPAPAPSTTSNAPAPARPAFADVAALVSALPTETASAEAPAAQPVARPSTPARQTPAPAQRAAPRTAARPVQAAARTPQQAHPSRVWVQLAVAPNPSGFGYEIGRMRRAAPELFRNRTAHVAPIGERKRLLVGPFPNDAAARTFVNSLKEKDISSLAWTSPAGTEVERLPAGR